MPCSFGLTAQGDCGQYGGIATPMPRPKNKLTAAQVAKTKRTGLHHDGGGLHLQVTAGVDGEPHKSWVLRYKSPSGRRREMGLGSAGVISLARARIKADAARALLDQGIDPIEHRKLERLRRQTEAATTVTFEQAAERFLDAHKSSWKNEKHRQQWENTLSNYVYPVFGAVPVQLVDVNLVLRVIEPIWLKKTETAARIRSRIERILDWAHARGLRDGENPARWRGRLENVLPARSLAQPVRHHPALAYAEMPAFMAELKQRNGMGAIALRFVILTAARTSEVRLATWKEIDLDNKLWTAPAAHMKAKRIHRVPLSDAAVALLQSTQFDRAGDDWVFPGLKPERPISDMTMLATLKTLRDGLTVHGFRSAFRDWAAERTDFPREVAEAALAHAVGDKVEAAYRRGDLFEKRRQLMDAWADYCEGREGALAAEA